ncbi:hypothetical protein PG1C_12140 [Rugosibacter aromaticivorans]|uniref:Uncharacterized protein n=1 Tax=Rugosibacter aromaticivorans TaxID=1565605 RepID=A0A0C5JNQ8_9PROT|nr:hypothetical protein [Rugosibacter aromaticivorans]AJP48971.1 hypothetical protein PG1C_12140 [Rugosibacter aromaticivorans]
MPTDKLPSENRPPSYKERRLAREATMTPAERAEQLKKDQLWKEFSDQFRAQVREQHGASNQAVPPQLKPSVLPHEAAMPKSQPARPKIKE